MVNKIKKNDIDHHNNLKWPSLPSDMAFVFCIQMQISSVGQSTSSLPSVMADAEQWRYVALN